MNNKKKITMKAKLIIAVVIGLSLSLFLCRCNKDEDNSNAGINTAKDHTIASNLYEDIFKQVGDAAITVEDSIEGKKGYSSINRGCPTITIDHFDLVTWPKNIVVDFGDECTDQYGVTRKGIINYNITTFYRDSGCVITVTPQDYYVNDYKVEGTKTITNDGHNASGNLTYTVQVTDAVITTPYNTTIQWNTTRVNEWVEGEPTILWPFDDVYLITGEAHGTNSNGKDFTITVVEPLNVIVGCRWIRSGTLDIVVEDIPTMTVDYGDGECDAEATITISGNEYGFNMY